MTTIEQERAAFALGKVELEETMAKRAKYRTQLLKLPARLHTNGFGQTIAFLLAQGDNTPERAVHNWLEEWLRIRNCYRQELRLIHAITGRGLTEDEDAEQLYRQAASEIRALSIWLKRFAEAFLVNASELEQP